MIVHIREHDRPLRIYQWGSLLREEQFSDRSDTDVAVEGIASLECRLRLEKELLDLSSFPLDLFRWENLWPEHRDRILARGKVVYERPD